MARKTLATLSSAKTVKLPSGNGYTPQSLVLVSSDRRYVICSGGGGNHIVRASSKSCTKLHSVIHTGHANGGCYCNKDGRVYTSTYSGSATKRIAVWKNWKYVKGIDLPVYCTGLAYDRITNNFYVSAGDHVYVFSYEQLNKKGKKKYGTVKMKHGVVGFWQDCGGYGGVIMRCTSRQNNSSTSYIDCYRAADGKYLGSLKTTGEIESVAVDDSLHFHVVHAQNRRIVETKQTFKSVGLYSVSGTATTGTHTATTVKASAKAQGNKIVKEARKHKGEGYKRFCSWAGINDDWCAIFVRWVFNKCGMSSIMSNKNYVPADFTKDIIEKGGKIIWSRDSRFKNPKGGSKKKCRPGDIALYGGHVNIVCKSSSDGSSLLTIGGNQHGKAPNGNWSNNEVTEYKRSDMLWVVRPAYKDVAYDEEAGEEEAVQGTLEVHPEQLYSSANFHYLDMTYNQEENESDKQARLAVTNMLDSAKGFTSAPRDSSSNIGILTGTIKSGSDKHPVTKVDGEAHGSTLSTALFPVEAPFAQITIGGQTFGAGWMDDAPNYINSLNVKRTNASMAEYTINLSHQVSPGRNPNYIDELLSANGYEKIGIKYGDARSDVVFNDSTAMVTGVNTSFDFVSCNIKYDVGAISSSFLSATNKRNRAAVTDKGSNIINNLLREANSSLAEFYPKMLDQNYVHRNNLIPTTDKAISLTAMENVNDITYLKEVVANMQSAANANSIYYLELREEDFKIHEVSTNGYSSTALLYEVDINYPDDAQIFTFTDNTDFAWPLAYEYNGSITNYSYDITRNGSLNSTPGNSNEMFNDYGTMNISQNWWKQVTEFPTTATLTCRGLLSPLLLMTYIKVNSYYYGSKRLTSGVYIVTGQEDEISGNGYRTALSLTKVSGPDQHLTLDARVKT